MIPGLTRQFDKKKLKYEFTRQVHSLKKENLWIVCDLNQLTSN